MAREVPPCRIAPPNPVVGGRLERQVIDVLIASLCAGYLVSALVGLPLYADGAHYLFRIIVDGQPYVPDGRLTAVLPQVPAFLSAQLGTDLALLRLIFSLAYASLPALSLLGCWLLVRRRAPGLMVFPALAALLNQINFSGVSELLAVLYLTWPLLIALLLWPRHWGPRAAAWIAGPLLVWLHPAAAAACFALAVLVYLLHRAERCESKALPALALWLLGCTVARLVLSGVDMSAYEAAHVQGRGAVAYMATQTWAQHALLAVTAGLGPLIAWDRLKGDRAAAAAPLLARFAAVVLAVIVCLLAYEFLWGQGIRLKAGLTFIVAGALMLCAGIVALRLRPRDAQPPQPGAYRWTLVTATSLLGVVCLLAVKSSAWWTATRGLQNVISDSTRACIPHLRQAPFGLQWPWMAIVDEWNAPMNALLFRSGYREPGHDEPAPIPLLLPRDGCERLNRDGVAYMTDWLPISWTILDERLGPLRPLSDRPQPTKEMANERAR